MSVASSLATGVRGVAIFAFLIGAGLVGLWIRHPASPPIAANAVATLLRVNAYIGLPMALGSTGTTLVLAAGGALAALFVVIGWAVGDTSQIVLELARFFPLSDALAYHSCGTSLAAWGNFDAFPALCGRRILYPSLLASVLPGVGWSAYAALIVQGVLSGVAASAVVLQVAVLSSAAAAALAAVLLAIFVWQFTLGVFMTEVAGFTMGALGLCLLLTFAQSRRALWLGAGMALLSVGMTSRAGAVLIVPAVLMWVAIRFWHDDRLRRLLVIATLAAAFGPALQAAGAWRMGQDATNTGGNFSTVLYGLSIGSGQWLDAYSRFRNDFANLSEAETYRIVYAAALQNIREHPGVFVGSLSAAVGDYRDGLFRFGAASPWNSWLVALLAIGIARTLVQWRTMAGASLLVAMFFGELATAPLIMSVGERVFASSIAVRFALCAVGAQTVIELAARALGGVTLRPTIVAVPRLAVLVSALGLFVTVLMVVPLLPLGRPAGFRPLTPSGRCAAGLDEVISRIGGEAVMLTIMNSDQGPETLDPMRVRYDRLQKGHYLLNWYGPEIEQLPRPVTLLHAIDRSAARHVSLRLLAFQGFLQPASEPRVLCVDPSSSIQVAAASYAIIRDVQPLSR